MLAMLMLLGGVCVATYFSLAPGRDGQLSPLAYLFWILAPFSLGLFFIALALLSKRNFFIYLFILCGSLCLALGLGEVMTRLLPSLANPGNADDSEHSKHLSSSKADGKFFYEHDPMLGYAHPRGKRLAQRKIHGRELVYDILCTLDDDGRRITPCHPQAQNAVLLFGDSFTFGDGLQDDETFAWRLAGILGSDWQVFNYGVSGYGAHQALGLIEFGRIPFDLLTKDYRKIYAFFLTIQDHPRRACRYFSFGPEYDLCQGGARYLGQLPLSRGERFARLLQASTLAETFYPLLVNSSATELHVAILKKCMEEFRARGIAFEVLVWPDFRGMMEKLNAAGIPAVSLGDDFGIKGGFWHSTPEKWRISRWDRHPNADAANIIAGAIFGAIRQLQQ